MDSETSESSQGSSFLYRIAFYVGCLLAFLILRKVYDQLIRKICNYPPGDNGLPILGSFRQFFRSIKPECLDRDAGLTCKEYFRTGKSIFDEMSQGRDVAMMQFGWNRMVIINDLNLCKKLFMKSDFMNHNHSCPNFAAFVQINGEPMLFRRNLIHNSFLSLLNTNFLHENIDVMFKKIVFPTFDQLSLLKQTKYIDIDPCYVFHMAATWQDEQNENILTLLGPRTSKFDLNIFQEPIKMIENNETLEEYFYAHLYQWKYDLKTNQIISAQYIDAMLEMNTEFPQTHPKRHGYKPDTIFFAKISMMEYKSEPIVLRLSGIVKYDVDTS